VHVGHPEPQRRLEGHEGVLGHRVRIPQPVEADSLAGSAVVELIIMVKFHFSNFNMHESSIFQT
jgi:hypothetical protein